MSDYVIQVDRIHAIRPHLLDVLTVSFDQVSYDDAWLYCACLHYKGYSDWRLPSSEEYNHSFFSRAWYADRPTNMYNKRWRVQPVRSVHE